VELFIHVSLKEQRILGLEKNVVRNVVEKKDCETLRELLLTSA
jgi:hypothetical protein